MEKGSLVLLFAAIVVLSYVFGMIIKYGKIKSISYTDYILKTPNRWVFEGVLTTCGLSIIASTYLIFGNLFHILALAGLLFIGVAVFSRYNLNDFYSKAHIFCATGGFAALLLSPFLDFHMPLVSLIGVILTLGTSWILRKSEYKTLWVELMGIGAGLATVIFSTQHFLK